MTNPPTQISRLELAFITGLGTGYLRPASGTWGSLPPVLLAVALAAIGMDGRGIDAAVACAGIVFAASCLISGERAEVHFGQKDPKSVVADEVAGQALALLWIPWEAGMSQRNLMMAGLAFLLFRMFDILKPPPARQLERLPFGIGILLDDIAAGLFAAVSVQILVRFVL